jgi:hypothetical protein
MKMIIEGKKSGQRQTVTPEQYQSMVRRGIAGNYRVIQRDIPDVPVELSQVVEKMKRKAGKPDNDTGEPEAENPGNSNQNEETE